MQQGFFHSLFVKPIVLTTTKLLPFLNSQPIKLLHGILLPRVSRLLAGLRMIILRAHCILWIISIRNFNLLPVREFVICQNVLLQLLLIGHPVLLKLIDAIILVLQEVFIPDFFLDIQVKIVQLPHTLLSLFLMQCVPSQFL